MHGKFPQLHHMKSWTILSVTMKKTSKTTNHRLTMSIFPFCFLASSRHTTHAGEKNIKKHGMMYMFVVLLRSGGPKAPTWMQCTTVPLPTKNECHPAHPKIEIRIIRPYLKGIPTTLQVNIWGETRWWSLVKNSVEFWSCFERGNPWKHQQKYGRRLPKSVEVSNTPKKNEQLAPKKNMVDMMWICSLPSLERLGLVSDTSHILGPPKASQVQKPISHG